VSTRPAVASESQCIVRLRNFVASGVVVAASCAAFALQPGHQSRLGPIPGGEFSFTAMQLLLAAAAAYLALLGVYYARQREPTTSKSVVCLRVAGSFLRSPLVVLRQGLSRDERLALLATLLKAYFAPMMTISLARFMLGWLDNGWAIVTGGALDAGFAQMFNRYGFWFAMQAILFVDVLLFTIGYLVELPALKNEIRSVDPTLLGWAAALVCYPPFNGITSRVLGYQVSDFPQFDDPTAHLLLNVLLLVLMTIYASASVALGFKASNLTHRGIVTRGPYALVRHPSYTCKNVAWWIASAPLVSAAFVQSLSSGILALGSVAAWTLLYVLRAITEEDHLRSVDGAYAAYAARVRFRFVPGIV
jgi:protein-S-isoprenylcysteine O-methyltransferase Ste14